MLHRLFFAVVGIACCACSSLAAVPAEPAADTSTNTSTDTSADTSAHTAADTAADFYVAPDGSDEFSGKLATRSSDGRDGPFASLAAARQAVAKLKSQTGGKRPIRVLVRGGVYRLSQPLVFGPEDSGTAEGPITYAAYPGEQPIFSGGITITGWKKGEGDLWRAQVPRRKEARPMFRSLYVNGQRCTAARIPNEDWYFASGPGQQYKRDQAARRDVKNRTSFRFAGEQIKPWYNLDDVVVVYYHCWTTSRHRILEIDQNQKIVRLVHPSAWPMGWWGKDERFYVEHVREGLDAPGEWYLDSASNTLSYRPRPGEDMARAEVVAPQLEELLRLEGDPEGGKFVEHLVFDGLAFQHTDWVLPPSGQVDAQAAAFLSTAAVFARGARNCTFQRCQIAHTGGYGLWLASGCQNNRVVQCHIHDLGAGGVRLGEATLPKQPEQQALRNEVFNCFIHDGGKVFHAGVGVWIGKTSHNKVHHNEICDFYYTGVSVGWTWGYAPSEANHNLVEYNHIHHLGWGQLSDMGGVYCLGVSPGTRIANNVIHHVWAFSYGGWGLYTDEGSTDIVLENNIVYHVKDGCFHQHYGRENIVRNNILALSHTYGQIRRSRQEEHRSFNFQRNIVYYTQGELLGGNWSNDKFLMDYNCYWRADGQEPIFPGKLTFAQWQQHGHDRNSIVADPRFVDAENCDFRLRDDSPALKLGFKPIDTSTVGLIGPAEWVNLPKTVKRPQMKM